MKTKLITVALICLSFLLLLGGTVTSYANTIAVNEAQSLIDGIIDKKCRDSGADSVQEWIDSQLTENAGITAEWYILALCQYGDYDFAAYRGALQEYLAQNEVYSASTRLKYALALLATGGEEDYIHAMLNDSVGKQGIMSWVYGLHLLNNGCVSEKFTLEGVKAQLLSLQLSDGGFAVSGTAGDVDVTAMTLQALAPHYESDPTVKTAIDDALVFLSEKQLAQGDYSSYGVKNPESGAQVMIALSALGIDCETDSRFIKNGHTIIDGIANYRLTDGGFSHTYGGTLSENATVQVFFAMTAYLRMAEGSPSIYLFEKSEESPDLPETDEPPISQTPDTPAKDTVPTPSQKPSEPSQAKAQGSYKPWAVLVILGLGAVMCVVLVLLKKRHPKNFLALLVIVALLIGVVLVTDFQSAEDYYDGETASKENVIGKVTLTIRCDTVVGKSDAEYIPSDGVILETVEIAIEEGDTVYHILTEAAQQYGIQIDNRGTDSMAYIAGINYLYEAAFGDLSGWVYHVNGESPSVGCGEYVLADGDEIQWLYTCDLGNDVK